MKVIQRGHVYELDSRFPHANYQGKVTTVRFMNAEPGHEAPGVTTQEVMRMLIDRTHYCHNCLPHRVNEQIIWHMRQIIALHEARAIEQAAIKNEYRPEMVNLNDHGHFDLTERATSGYEETALKPLPAVGEDPGKPCHACDAQDPLWPPKA